MIGNKGNPHPLRAGESLRYPRGQPLKRQPVTPSDGLTPLSDAQIKARWRAAITANVSDSDIAFLVQRLVECAKRGEKWAMLQLMDRLAGKPMQSMEVADTTAERVMSEEEARNTLIQFIDENPQAVAETVAPPAGDEVRPEDGDTVPPSDGVTVERLADAPDTLPKFGPTIFE